MSTLRVLGPEVGVASAARDWWDYQWTLVSGCTRVSEGCRHCTAETVASRHHSQEFARPTPAGPRWTGVVRTRPDRLRDPEIWEEPKWVFAVSQSDLFHPAVPESFVEASLDAMASWPRHRFGILTKRSDRMAMFFRGRRAPDNVMVGVTVESQEVIERVRDLLTVDTRLRWISAEPLLGPLKLRNVLGPDKVGWVACGPEIGFEARPCDPDWMMDVRAQCLDAGVPFFTKHLLNGESYRDRPE